MRAGWLTLALLSLRLTAQGPVYSKQQPVETGKASIEGTVIDASTREPVKKATVMLMGHSRLTAVTDASGHFAFRQLPAGQYSIQAQNERYPFLPPGIEGGHFHSVTLAAEEQKRDIDLRLTPGALIRGRVVDEEGNPMARCSVMAMQFRDTDAGRTLQSVSLGTSDDLGEYRILKVLAGKYYILARCYQPVTLPHAFIRRGSIMDLPVRTYLPQFYPGAPDPAGATKVEAQTNASIAGIDFRMQPATGITVRGHVGPLAPDRTLQILLEPKDSVRKAWQSQNARINGSNGEFRVPEVTAGSYELIALGSGDGHSYYARIPLEIDKTPLEPIEVALALAPSIGGTISIDGEARTAMTSLQVRLTPFDPTHQAMGDAPQAEVASDGTFTLKSVVPGHWRLAVNNAPGYLKSVTLGDQEVFPWDLEIGPAAGPLKIVIGMKFPEVTVSLAAPPLEAGQYYAIIWDEHGYRNIQVIGQKGPAKLGFVPGKFHLCAVAWTHPYALLENPALRKALESVCETVDVGEGGSASVQMRLVTAQELRKIAEKLEE